ncbi:EamA family transporter RarD [Bacillus sp. 03113]|uniref:EamA family transporter RarD n=1 Tax=Bacillus sp. 03113 TaxID=2578211 RepID=UPI001143530A|nr:EamA family transporter RarD [Bacillus sp. 03113]
MKNENNQTTGMLYAIFAYFMWGIFPLYWKLIHSVSSFEILAHRIFWSFIFMIFLLVFSKKLKLFFTSLKKLIQSPRNLLFLLIASILVSMNWVLYIWSVNHGHIIETSLGYYINPLITILLGIVFLKEKLNPWQVVAIVLAFSGVVLLTFEFGQIPWIALTLAFTFAFYGLIKKYIKLDAMVGLTIETMFVAPIALIYLITLKVNDSISFGTGSLMTTLLLLGTGIATALPLLCFAEAGKRISLTMIGFFQYISPTITLVIGIFVFKENFSQAQLTSFLFIWAALIIFSLAETKFMTKFLHKGKPIHVGK